MAVPPIPSHLTLYLATPERSLTHEQVDEVEIPGVGGYFGVLPGHSPLLAMLQVGQLWYRKGNEKFYLSIAFGFAEVLPDRVTILAQVAERGEDIDASRAEAALARARDRLAKPLPDIDFDRARISVMKAMIRSQVASKARVRT